jgi:hypothetical protein
MALCRLFAVVDIQFGTLNGEDVPWHRSLQVEMIFLDYVITLI